MTNMLMCQYRSRSSSARYDMYIGRDLRDRFCCRVISSACGEIQLADTGESNATFVKTGSEVNARGKSKPIEATDPFLDAAELSNRGPDYTGQRRGGDGGNSLDDELSPVTRELARIPGPVAYSYRFYLRHFRRQVSAPAAQEFRIRSGTRLLGGHCQLRCCAGRTGLRFGNARGVRCRDTYILCQLRN